MQRAFLLRPALFNISGNTVSIGLVLANGFNININPGQQIPVKLFFNNVTIGLGTGRLDNPPVFKVCDAYLVCNNATVPIAYEVIFNTDGLSPGEIAGIVAAVLFVVGGVAGISIYFDRKKAHAQRPTPHPKKPRRTLEMVAQARTSKDQYVTPKD